jgi:hypothetical protein
MVKKDVLKKKYKCLKTRKPKLTSPDLKTRGLYLISIFFDCRISPAELFAGGIFCEQV